MCRYIVLVATLLMGTINAAHAVECGLDEKEIYRHSTAVPIDLDSLQQHWLKMTQNPMSRLKAQAIAKAFVVYQPFQLYGLVCTKIKPVSLPVPTVVFGK